MRKLYPSLQPYVAHTLQVDRTHTLHVEECGRPDGVPVVFLHGGPGGGCSPYHRQFFDPNVYRIVLFDQRGCGRSTPHAELEANTTQHLLADMEAIRVHLGIDRWAVFGGSWGSTLALVYAEAYPDRILGLVLRGIFLCRPRDIHWFYQEGASRIFPDYWQAFVEPIPADERDDLLRAYHRRLAGEDEIARMAAAKAWSVWEARCATSKPDSSLVSHFGEPYTALSLARIESHYFVNDAFLQHDQILRNASRLSGLPGTIVHGRYDVVCPVEQAWELHQAWPSAELIIVRDAGHAASEAGIVDALIKATDALGRRLS
jgi:proline iminopeptidase